MNYNVLFVNDADREDGVQLYTKVQLKYLSDTVRSSNKDASDYVLDTFEATPDDDEEDIIRRFQAEKYGSRDTQEPSWIQLVDCDEDLARKYLSANITTNVEIGDANEQLSIDILYPYRTDEFKQFHGDYHLSNIKLQGLLEGMPVGMKVKWLKALLFDEMYSRGNYIIEFKNGHDCPTFRVKLKHSGIFKTILELKLKETTVDINSNLLNDLLMLKTKEISYKAKEMRWNKDKGALIKCILKLSDLSNIKELSKHIQTNLDYNEQLKSALDGVDLVKYKKNNPFSELDELKFKTDELFKVVIPNFYVPIIQKLQKRVIELNSVSTSHKRERDSDQSTIESDDDRHVEKKLHAEDSPTSEEGEILSEDTQLSD